jgi:hypothetical protein
MKREGLGWLRLSLSCPSSPSPTRVSFSNPSRRRWISSFPSSLRRSSRSRTIAAASSAASYASFVGGARPRFWWSMVARGDKPSADLTAVAPGDARLQVRPASPSSVLGSLPSHILSLSPTISREEIWEHEIDSPPMLDPVIQHAAQPVLEQKNHQS